MVDSWILVQHVFSFTKFVRSKRCQISSNFAFFGFFILLTYFIEKMLSLLKNVPVLMHVDDRYIFSHNRFFLDIVN